MTEPDAPAERAILDTSVLIADQVAPISGALAISTITLAELNFGVLVAKSTEVRAERLRRLSLLQRPGAVADPRGRDRPAPDLRFAPGRRPGSAGLPAAA
jgi:hypothetical protein